VRPLIGGVESAAAGRPDRRRRRPIPILLWVRAVRHALYRDLPQALQDRGGSQSRGTAEAVDEYAGYVAEHLSDRSRHFTMNEFQNFVDVGLQGVKIVVRAEPRGSSSRRE
jgi:hypothetical protein